MAAHAIAATGISIEILVPMALAVLVAAFIQGTTGFGFALTVAPVVGLLEPRLLPVALLILMIPLNVYIAWRERSALDLRGARWVILGRTVGTVGGLWVLTAVPAGRLSLLIGGATILAVLATLAVPPFQPGRAAYLGAGTITGITETATGIGGPPLALVFQHRPAPVLRSTVAVCFVVGEVISLGLLGAAGRIDANQIRVALFLLPVLGLGALLSVLAHHRVRGQLLRTLVLGFALISGIVAIIHP